MLPCTPQRQEWSALCKSGPSWACNASALPHWNTKLTAKLDKRVEVEGLCVSGGTQRIAQSKTFALILSSKMLSGLEADYPAS